MCIRDRRDPHQRPQAFTEAGQAARRLCAALGFVGNAVNGHRDLVHAAVDLFGHSRLLLGGTGDLRVHGIDRCDQLGNCLLYTSRCV